MNYKLSDESSAVACQEATRSGGAGAGGGGGAGGTDRGDHARSRRRPVPVGGAPVDAAVAASGDRHQPADHGAGALVGAHGRGARRRGRRRVAVVGLPRRWRRPAAGTGFGVGVPSKVESALLSPTAPGCVPQDHLERVLLDHLHAMADARVEIGTELVGSRTARPVFERPCAMWRPIAVESCGPATWSRPTACAARSNWLGVAHHGMITSTRASPSCFTHPCGTSRPSTGTASTA